jgi:hypothetical protein
MQNNESRFRIFLHGLRRYGSYIILSLFFCLWVADLNLFLSLGEVIGAIGFYALISLGLLLLFYKWRFWLLIVVYGFSFFLREYVSHTPGLPAISPFFLGFTVWLMLPFMFTGIFLAEAIVQKELKKMFLFDMALLPAMVLSVFWSDKISYFEGTLSFVLISIFLAIILFIVITPIQDSKLLRIFSFIGKHPLLFYFAHQAVFFKVALQLNIFHNFDTLYSLIGTSLLVFFTLITAKGFDILKPKMVKLRVTDHERGKLNQLISVLKRT